MRRQPADEPIAYLSPNTERTSTCMLLPPMPTPRCHRHVPLPPPTAVPQAALLLSNWQCRPRSGQLSGSTQAVARPCCEPCSPYETQPPAKDTTMQSPPSHPSGDTRQVHHLPYLPSRTFSTDPGGSQVWVHLLLPLPPPPLHQPILCYHYLRGRPHQFQPVVCLCPHYRCQNHHLLLRTGWPSLAASLSRRP